MASETKGGGAAEAYDRLAPVYNRFNDDDSYERWLGKVLLPEMEKHGLRRGRVLDVGCGTGRAFPPLLSRGWEVFGFDVSRGMLRQARAKFQTDKVHIWSGDARALGDNGNPFDLILALNDVINYLVDDGDLERVFAGFRQNLAPHGLLCFDANTLGLYEREWLAGSPATMGQRGWEWTGLSKEAAPGRVFEVEIRTDGIEPSFHRQRHWERSTIESAMNRSGLRCLAVLGQRGQGDRILLEDSPDESRHYKLIYIAPPDAA